LGPGGVRALEDEADLDELLPDDDAPALSPAPAEAVVVAAPAPAVAPVDLPLPGASLRDELLAIRALLQLD
ncbi:MAG: hypothetical protein U1F21_17610, partial [Sphaerotilus natans]